MVYFKPKDSVARVTIVNPLRPETPDPREYFIVVTSDETTMSTFECMPQMGGLITCVFASNGPNLYKIDFVEDPAAGLVQKVKFAYQLFNDNYGVKVVFNRMFFAVMTMSTASGLTRVLIYRNQEQRGSNTLWSGINIDSLTNRPPRDVDIALTDSNNIIFTTNSVFSNATVTLSQIAKIANATITPRTSKIDELAQERLLVNTKSSDITVTPIPLSHFFLHIDERNGAGKGLGGQFWILMIISFLLIYAGIYWAYRRENIRRTKLREEVLCNNLGDTLKF